MTNFLQKIGWFCINKIDTLMSDLLTKLRDTILHHQTHISPMNELIDSLIKLKEIAIVAGYLEKGHSVFLFLYFCLFISLQQQMFFKNC